MSDQLFIALQGLLAFGVPLAIAVNELLKLNRDKPTPAGGGEPRLVFTGALRATLERPEAANANTAGRRAA